MYSNIATVAVLSEMACVPPVMTTATLATSLSATEMMSLSTERATAVVVSSLPNEVRLSLLPEAVGVPAVVAAVAVALALPTEAVFSLPSIVVYNNRPQLVKETAALKLVIHLSATGTALEHDGSRDVIHCNGEKFCFACVNLYDGSQQ